MNILLLLFKPYEVAVLDFFGGNVIFSNFITYNCEKVRHIL